MKGYKSALRALLTQAGFEFAVAAAEVSRAARVTAHAEQETSVSASRCEAAAGQLRDLGSRLGVNPPLHDLMQRLYHEEMQQLHSWQQQLADAEQSEAKARAALADVHKRERGLHRALQGERRKHARRLANIELATIDDLWLQRTSRELA